MGIKRLGFGAALEDELRQEGNSGAQLRSAKSALNRERPLGQDLHEGHALLRTMVHVSAVLRDRSAIRHALRNAAVENQIPTTIPAMRQMDPELCR